MRRPAIAWHQRMEARVVLGLACIVGCSLAAILVATTRVVTDRSMERASAELQVTRDAFYRSLDARAQTASALARLVTELPVFRAHLSDARLSRDAATIEAMADGYRRDLRAQFSIVTDAAGGWLGAAGWPDGQDVPTPLRVSVGAAREGREQRGVAGVQGQLFLVVSEPARFAEEIVGTFTVGYLLDDAVAQELARATQCEVAIVSPAHVYAASLPRERHADLRAFLQRHPYDDGRAGSSIQRVKDISYVANTFPLLPGASTGVEADGRLVLLQDWRPTQRFLDELFRRSAAAAALVFGAALVGGIAFGRRMSRPLRAIAEAADEIAAGNLDRHLPVQGTAEATTVALAFNQMSASLRTTRERLLHDAIHDHLTQLPNRVLLMERIDRRLATADQPGRHGFGLLHIDLDRFKTVNDSLGHAAGDHMLVELGRRLAGSIRCVDVVARSGEPDHAEAGTVARVGGDEFTLLLEDVRDPSDVVRVAERIQRALAAPVSIGGRDVFPTASIGIVVPTPAHRTGEALFRDATTAMHRAKASGGNRYVLFDETMHSRALERFQLETDLRHALDHEELELLFQPIVRVKGLQIVGFEALVRWNHPQRGQLLPADFLATADSAGLMTRIDDWVLARACQHARDWEQVLPPARCPSVSVNISAQSFGQLQLVDKVRCALRDTGLAPARLRLEVTEGVAIADAQSARDVLGQLKAVGVGISLDDFGTGYSSLSYLQRFPVDTMKIDRSFVEGVGHDRHAGEIVRAIVDLARTLALKVVAEGVEGPVQLDALEALGCSYAQGHSLGIPIPSTRVLLDLAGARAPELPGSLTPGNRHRRGLTVQSPGVAGSLDVEGFAF